MNRIIDHQPENEEHVVARILVKVHKAIDEAFPDAAPSSQRFAKTVFTEHEAAEGVPPSPPAAAAVTKEKKPLRETSSVHRVSEKPVTESRYLSEDKALSSLLEPSILDTKIIRPRRRLGLLLAFLGPFVLFFVLYFFFPSAYQHLLMLLLQLIE